MLGEPKQEGRTENMKTGRIGVLTSKWNKSHKHPKVLNTVLEKFKSVHSIHDGRLPLQKISQNSSWLCQ